MKKPRWKTEPDEHDYAAAAQYLSLSEDSKREIEHTIHLLRNAKCSKYFAKDIVRVARLPLLPISNKHVVRNLGRIRRKELLSPVLLVRGSRGNPLVIADGYHRVCAVYHASEDDVVECRIA